MCVWCVLCVCVCVFFFFVFFCFVLLICNGQCLISQHAMAEIRVAGGFV